MKERDIWFCRYRDELWVVTTEPAQPPNHRARRVSGVGSTLRRVRAKGYDVVQIGILDPERMGLE